METLARVAPLRLLSIRVARQLPIVAFALVYLAVCGRIRPLVPIVAVCAYFTLVYMITWKVRYSEPQHPLLAIILVTAASEGFNVFKRGRGDVSL